MRIDFLTIEEQEDYLHFLFCKRVLSESSVIFKDVQRDNEHPLADSAFGYALVQYAVPFTNSHTASGQVLRLPRKYIPSDSIDLHKQIMQERHKLHAHLDLSWIDPKLRSVEKVQGVVYSTFSSQPILRFHMIQRISEIVDLVSAILENMVEDSLVKEREILARKPK